MGWLKPEPVTIALLLGVWCVYELSKIRGLLSRILDQLQDADEDNRRTRRAREQTLRDMR